MSKYPPRINNIRVKDDHNLFILSAKDKDDRLVIKLFYSTAEKIIEGFKKSDKYTLEYSGYRWDAKEFMQMIRITAPETKYFDGWINGRFLQDYIEMLENKDYSKFINYYTTIGIKRLEMSPKVDTMTDKEYDIAQIARYEKYSKRFRK